MSSYPVILIPHQLQSVSHSLKNAEPEKPRFPDPRPQKPTIQKPERLKQDIYYWGLGLLLISILGGASSQFFVSLIACILLFLLGLYAGEQIESYPARLRDFSLKMSAYKRKLQDYEAKKIQFEEQYSKQKLSRAELILYRQAEIQSFLSNSVSSYLVESNAKQGFSEAEFESYLNKFFSKKIKTDAGLSIPNYDYPYTPDFCLIEGSLHIDIEIDEPYDYHKKEAIHCNDHWKDKRRNDFFVDNGWIVIRFAEEQVCRQPESCCKVVAEVIQEILYQPIPKKLADVEKLKKINCWSEDEATQMADQNYRETYLRNYRSSILKSRA